MTYLRPTLMARLEYVNNIKDFMYIKKLNRGQKDCFAQLMMTWTQMI